MKTVIKNISSHQESTTSMFVTSSGESASVVDLRAKQEARRKRAVMFKRQIEVSSRVCAVVLFHNLLVCSI